MRDCDLCLKLIRVRLEAIADNKYASQKMARQAARDALKDLDSLEEQLNERLQALASGTRQGQDS